MKIKASKTIPFKQGDKKNKISKYSMINSESSNKIIPYPKYRKNKRNTKELIKKNKAILVLVILAFCFSFISYFNNKSKLTDNNIISNYSLTQSEFSSNSKIIKKDVKKILNLSNNYKVTTRGMHKNGNLIYAQGSYKLDSNNEVYFDALLKDNKTCSLIIDGIEYINKIKSE